MALYEQLGNFVKLRTTPLTINGVANSVHDYERIHITKFNMRELGDDVIAFASGERTVLTISGDTMADNYDNKTVAQIITDASAFIDALEEG